MRKANAAFSDSDSRGERIVAIDDRVIFKVKVRRWRGALWRPVPEQWLCAALPTLHAQYVPIQHGGFVVS